jgi:hypothetical protein
MTALPVVVVLALLANAAPPGKLHKAVTNAQKCKASNSEPGRMDCDYDLGSLHFSIEAVGRGDGGFTIYKADWDKDYALSYGVQHGCLIVKWGDKKMNADNAFEMVFVSFATGGVYTDWGTCKNARPR